MKTIEEIERISFEDLERISADKKIAVPVGLEAKIAARLICIENRKQSKRFRARAAYASSAAGLAATLAVVLMIASPQRPKDSFDDPVLARAELERTFAYISEKIDNGMGLVEESAAFMEKPAQMISKLK